MSIAHALTIINSFVPDSKNFTDITKYKLKTAKRE
jgi:hypothetical protein